jgi:hypothetical protein
MKALLRELESLVQTPEAEPGPLISIAWINAPLDRPARKAPTLDEAAPAG